MIPIPEPAPLQPAPLQPEQLAFIGFSDLSGLLRGKSIPLGALPARMNRGVGVAPANLMMSAFGPIYSSPFGTAGEVVVVPDPSTRTAIPMAEGPDCALLLGDFRTTAGEPWPFCPRTFLRRGLDALTDEFGLTLHAAFEQELVYTGVPDEPGAPYTLGNLRRQGAFGGTLLAAFRAAGIAPDSFLAEYAPRQFEVTCGPKPGLRAADEAALGRELARAWAARLGHRAIFAPMPRADGVGNGTHIHWSLWHGDQPATHDPARHLGLSGLAEHFTAGLLHHLPALTAVTAPSVASFYRLRPDRWAPVSANLGEHDRGSAVRVCPIYPDPGHDPAHQFNVEFRVADATASPHLALGALVHAGLDGLRTRRILATLAETPLPRSLPEALDLFEASPAARAWFGDAFHAAYARFKRDEVAALHGLDEQQICDRYARIY